MSKQYALVFDLRRCVGCGTCVIACKVENNLEGGYSCMKVVPQSNGSYPDFTMYFQPMPCMHCQEPPCIDSCHVRAIYKQDGVILINEDRCNGCGECILACPYQVLYLKRGVPPCKAACPIGQDVQGYTALISEGKFKEALEIIRETNPLPGICGRICAHPCEEQCLRTKVDEPIAIADLKRFAADYELKVGAEEITPAPQTREEQVAIIGSGPAGLAAVHDLVNMG